MALKNYITGSSAIVSLGFDSGAGVEEVEDIPVPIPSAYGTVYMTFKDGRSYTIENFPAIELERWVNSPSIGGYFNAYVKGNY
jgi:hypothetical protein